MDELMLNRVWSDPCEGFPIFRVTRGAVHELMPMQIGLIAPPFIEVPPRRYGGTELFIANLARDLHARGHDVTVYGNGDSRLPCRVKWRYAHAEWPLDDPIRPQLKNADHTAWAVHDAAASVDVLHLNDIVGIPFTTFVDLPAVLTIHHPHEPALSEQYAKYPGIHYVTIARWLARREPMPCKHVVHHGIPLADYTFSEEKDDYVAFLGRMAPCKGPHLAIEAARLAGVRLKLAGEVQPVFREYWDQQVRPGIDGEQIEYVGEADHATKNALLSRARALLFPIEWEEPFGLVMIEAMACGTPVLAFAGGSVEEIVHDGINGWICNDVAEMASRIASVDVEPAACREFVESRFSVARMTDRYLQVYERALRGAVGVSAARPQA
jgi:glycosyltransferase involved in cell wall biosynthesis